MSFRRFSRRLAALAPSDGSTWVVLRSVDSTNSLARRVMAEYAGQDLPPVPAVFFAYQQSRGRGRGDHLWISPTGAGAYVSLLLPDIALQRLASLPLLVAVGLARALEPRLIRPVRLRWPNDLLVAGRKIGGVLIESLAMPGAGASVVVGFGVNYAPGDPPVPGATSICEESAMAAREPTAEDLAEAAASLVGGVETELSRLGDDAYAVRSYTALSLHREGDLLSCRTAHGTLEGRFRGFDQRGFLRLETADGERSLGVGELIPVVEP